MLKNTLNRFNLLLFAPDDGAGAGGGEGEGGGSQSGGSSGSGQTGKVYSDEYVRTLREEAKGHRLQHKAAEKKLRYVLGVGDDVDLTDEAISNYKAKLDSEKNNELAKAKNLLVKAELRSMDGINFKLAEKLLDLSKIKVDDEGKVEGLKEALNELVKEFPEIKQGPRGAGGTSGGANPPSGAGGGGDSSAGMNDFIRKAAGR